MSEGIEPIWLAAVQLRMMHADTLKLFGGSPGVRDEGLLESALGRPRHLWAYSSAVTLFDLAAAYGFGIIKNHAFIDGNKRAGALGIRAFLFRNGYRFAPDQVEMVATIEGVAAGAVSEEELATWVEEYSTLR